MDEHSTAELTRRMARGDTEALAVFYERWFDMMYREARQLTRRDEAFCLDVVQDAMLRIVKRMSVKNSDAQLAAWLGSVVRSCAYDRLRSEQSRRRRERSRQSATTPARADGHAPADADEQRQWLSRELDSLDDSLRQPLVLRMLAGRTLAQVGAALGLTTGAVDGRVNRALTKLRRSAARDGQVSDD